MRRRLTARVLLFDADQRLLLMKGRLSRASDAPGGWFTVGGGAEPGETILEAAAREIREETGLTGVRLGPVIWRREGVLQLHDEPVLFDEHYVLARCTAGALSRDGWDAAEQALIDDVRWWTHEELLATSEPVFPPGLADLLHDVLAGRWPETPRRIPWR